MNKLEHGRSVTKSAFEEVRLSLDPATLDLALGKRKVRAIEPDGSLVYEEERTTGEKFTEQLERIWNEYPDGLLDLSEDRLDRLLPDANAVKDQCQDEEVEQARDLSKLMEHEEMEKLRSEVFGSLNDARNELWFVLELAKTLAVSPSFTNQAPPPPTNALHLGSKKGKPKAPTKASEVDAKSLIPAAATAEPPILPPGTFSTTPSSQPSKTSHAQVHELELILAAKQQALDECSALIDSAVTELQTMSSAGDRFWRDVRSLKDGRGAKEQWGIVPKPEFGQSTGDNQKAKDIIIPYAIDEASRAQRSRCLAAFDLDPKKEDTLTFGSRSFLRLRVTLRDDSGAAVCSTPVRTGSSSDVREQMELAQMESFDEELFNEVRLEAGRMAQSEIGPRSVAVPAAEHTLTFELYDTRYPPTNTLSPLCDLIVSSARLNLLNLHRHHKARLIRGSNHNSEANPSILLLIIQALRYRQLCRIVNSALANFARTLNAANVKAVVTQCTSAGREHPAGIRDLLLGTTALGIISKTFTLEIAGCPGVRIDTREPYCTRVILPNAVFEISNPDGLPHILAEPLENQLLRLADTTLRGMLPSSPSRSKLFLDELESIVHLGARGYLRMTIPPPFHSILGRVEYPEGYVNVSEEDPIRGFDSRRDGDVHAWLDDLAGRIAVSHS